MNGLTGVLVGALVTLLGTLVVYEQERRKRGSEEERWYGQLFLQRKFDALSRLHETLVDCRVAFGVVDLGSEDTYMKRGIEAYEVKLQAKQDALVRARVVASIYLTADEDAQIGLAVEGFAKAFEEIRARIRNYIERVNAGKGAPFSWLTDEDSQKFMQGFTPATECLRRLLAPRFPGLTESKRGTKGSTIRE